ncbi:hypothetical protein AYO43_11100 [Nitrospira sp. SCGC AG-212-E16]|nr:hypothetical protein AYO43_11100 [Nitrospira sp. SCGC AG-212-E16]
MPREATLFESADGSVLKGYRLLQRGGANIPPMWIQRASESRCRLHKDVAQALRRKSKAGQSTLKEWETVTTKNVSITDCACSLNWEGRAKRD